MTGGVEKEYQQFIRKALELPAATVVHIALFFTGGSDRSFHLVRTSDQRSYVFMHYDPARKENNYYAAIAGFLQSIGVRVPRVVRHDPVKCFILMEDLGETDLWSFQSAPWKKRRMMYQKTLDLAGRLHAFPLGDFPSRAVPLMEAFGSALYRWERDYFRENFVEGLCKIKLGPQDVRQLESELAGLAERIGQGRRSLVHRDLQSRNVIVSGGEPALIDFQGMREGNPLYDIGSLLYDPYITFSGDERRELLLYYAGLSDVPADRDALQTSFLEASAQRLMQALGAYGFLGLKRGLSGFLEHIPSAIGNLIDASSRAGSLPRLLELATRCKKIVSTFDPKG